MEEMIKTGKMQTGTDFTLEFINYESENTFDVKENTFKENRIYHVKVICNDGRTAKISVTMPEIHKGKWLDKIPFIVRYKSKKAMKEMLEECIGKGELSQEPCTVKFDKIGWQTHPKYGAMFLFSNGAMTEHGFRKDICSTITRYDYIHEKCLGGEEKNNQVEFINNVIWGDQTEIIWIHTVMSIIRQPLRQHGIDLGIALLIYGKPASGKTELMKNLTNVLGTPQSELPKRLLQTGMSTRELLTCQAESKGIPVMLDDVKKERDQTSREHSEVVTDAMIRSNYEGKLTKTYRQSDIDVATNLVITSEHIRPSRSQMGRMLWLNVNDYLKDSRHSKKLRNIQEHPEYAGSFYGGFIKWFASKLNQPGVVASWRKKYLEMQEENRTYLAFEDGTRIQTDANYLEFTYSIIMQYLEDEFTLDETDRIYLENSVKYNIKCVIYQTAEQMGGMRSIYMRIWEEIIKNSKIREAEYRMIPEYQRNRYGLVWDQREFCLWLGDEFLYISDIDKAGTNKESFENAHPRSILVIDEGVLEDKFKQAKKIIMQNVEISKEVYDQLSWEKLANYGIMLFTSERSGGYERRRYRKCYPRIVATNETCYSEYMHREYTHVNLEYSEVYALSFNINSISLDLLEERTRPSSELKGSLDDEAEKCIQTGIRRFISGRQICQRG